MTNDVERIERVARMEAHRRYEALPQVNAFIAGVLWRSGITAAEFATLRPELVMTGDLVIDIQNHAATKAGKPARLTNKEGLLLVAIARRRGELVPSLTLMHEVWGEQYTHGEDHFLRMLMSALRLKIGRDYIITAWGEGYRLAMYPVPPLPLDDANVTEQSGPATEARAPGEEQAEQP